MTIFLLFTTVICVCYFLLMLLYLIGWKKTPAFSFNSDGIPEAAISIIVPVRNEEKNIQSILSSLSKQAYPKNKYEVIVVDDFSEDNTIAAAKALNISIIKIIPLSGKGGKKNAITEGVKNASGDLIITTDADCEMGEKWLSAINSFYQKEKPKLMVGPVLVKAEKSFFQIIQSQEITVLTACAGAALYYDMPILCSGANLIYEKEAFLAVNGYEGNDSIPSGDDVFLMFKIHKQFPKQVKYVKSRDGAVYTHPATALDAALNQRKRWASKTFSYEDMIVLAIAVLVFLTNLFLVLFFLLFLVKGVGLILFLLLAGMKITVDYLILNSANAFFSKKNHTASFFLISIFYPVYVSLIGFCAPFTGYSWKGRKP